MYKTLLATSAAALFVATSAFAQTATTPDWSGAVGEAFFTDDTMSTLRTEAEIQTAWEGLSEEERAQVQADCEMMGGDVAASGGTGDDMAAPPAGGSGATGGSSTGTGTGGGSDAGGDSGSDSSSSGESATTGSPTATETAMGDVCAMISSF